MFLKVAMRTPFSMQSVCMTVAGNIDCCHTVESSDWVKNQLPSGIVSNQLDMWFDEFLSMFEIPFMRLIKLI